MKCLPWRAAIIAAVVLLPTAARAELRPEFKLEGMDCVYCNGAMSTAVKKLEGVESVELIAEKGVAIIRLKPDNTITLQQLRRVIKSVGYDAKAADITARGRIGGDAAPATVDLLNGSVLKLAAPPAHTSDAVVELTGVVKPAENGDEILTVATIK
jgi:copper chaperone CopZ